ncbi:MAG: choice-of-anchor Q domain-containing protein, partial [Flavobacteriales bacterium]
MKVLRFAVFMLVALTAEIAQGAVIYVDENAVGPPTGVSWTNAFTNLYNALFVAQPGDEIWVAAGVYRPTDSPNRNAVLVLNEGVALYGGFNGTETSRNQRNWTANLTVISGDIGVALINTDNSRRLINVVGTEVIVDGFRLRGCYDETPLSTGAINVAPGATLWVRNCSFGNNQAEGASVAVVSGIAAFDNCLVEGNTNTSNSGLIHGSAGGIIEIRHCTFSGNVLGGISNVIGGAPVADVRVYNSIIAEGSFNSSILDYIGNSVSEGPVLGATLTAENLITASPLFVNQAAGDYRLQAASPAIDHGSLSIVSSNRDLNGRPRVMNVAPDAGCYEYVDRPIVFVNPTATGNGSGFTWNNAFTDLQVALASATAGSQIWVKEGVYRPTTTNNRFTSFTLSHDVPVYGGFVGGETALDQRDWRTHLTILSGNIGSQSDALDNSYNVVVCNQVNGVFTLDGCVVRAGYADGSTAQRQRGAGIRVNNANFVNLYNCTINNNYASDEGAAVFVQNATELRVVSSNIVNNEANLSAAVFANASLLFESTAIISNANTGSGQLKGIVSQSPNYELSIYNCTVTGNDFPGTASSFLISNPGPFDVRNSIISGNTIPENSAVISFGFGSSSISRSILQGNPIPNATQNVSYGDPGFFNPAQNDYRLLATSPGFNAGSNAFIALSAYDANGNPRIAFGTVDYGAFEADEELAAIIYVNHAATGTNDGTSWANAYTSMQAALAATTENRQIWIAAGTYKPSLTDNIFESFQVSGRLLIYGGFDGTETSLNERNWVENPVVFSGDIGVPNDELDNSREILVVSGSDLDVYIDGIT